MRKDQPIDPEMEAELIELEAALNRSPDADNDLVEFAAAVQGGRPEPSAELISRLNGSVAEGFAAGGKTTDRQRTGLRMPSMRVLIPAGALAATAAVVAIAVSTSEAPRGPGDGGVQIAQEPQPQAGADSSSKRESGDSGITAGEPTTSLVAPTNVPGSEEDMDPNASATRRVERSASITLGTSDRDVQATTDEVVKVAGRVGGYVASSSLSVQGEDGTATIRLRVPTNRLDEAMSALGRLGEVRSIDQAEQDITGTFSAAAAEVKDAKAERIGLLSAMRRSDDEQQIARLRVRLRENAARITGAERTLAGIRARAARATIDVRVTSAKDGAGTIEPQEQGFGVGPAIDTALKVLSTSAGVLIVVLAAAIPLLLLTLVGLTMVKVARRRSRESALDRD